MYALNPSGGNTVGSRKRFVVLEVVAVKHAVVGPGEEAEVVDSLDERLAGSQLGSRLKHDCRRSNFPISRHIRFRNVFAPMRKRADLNEL